MYFLNENKLMSFNVNIPIYFSVQRNYFLRFFFSNIYRSNSITQKKIQLCLMSLDRQTNYSNYEMKSNYFKVDRIQDNNIYLYKIIHKK